MRTIGSEHAKALKCGRHRDCSDDVRRNEELKAKQDASSEIGAKAFVGLVPIGGAEAATQEQARQR